MSVTVLNLTEASTLLRTINKRDIKDVRAIEGDLALVLESGHKIIISRGAVAAVNSPQLVLEFADGDVALGDAFEKLNHIEVPAESSAAFTSTDNVLGKSVPVVNGRYTLVLDRPDYRGLILLAVRDNTPGVADNFADEATLRLTDLGNTVLRSAVMADGSNQTVNVTALTELAVLKAGLAAGQTSLAASQVGATHVTAANAAVSALFKVNVTSGAVVTTTTTDSKGAAVVNPEFVSNTNTDARNYGIALKAIANLQLTNPDRYPNQGTAIQKLADSGGHDVAQRGEGIGAGRRPGLQGGIDECQRGLMLGAGDAHAVEVGCCRCRVAVVVAIDRGFEQGGGGGADGAVDQRPQAGQFIDLFRLRSGGHGAQDGRQEGGVDGLSQQVRQAGCAIVLGETEPGLLQRLVARGLGALQRGLRCRQGGLLGCLLGDRCLVQRLLGADHSGLGLVERLLAAGYQHRLFDDAGAVGNEGLGTVGEVAGRIHLAHQQARLAVALQGLAVQLQLVAALPANPATRREHLPHAASAQHHQREAIGPGAAHQAQVDFCTGFKGGHRAEDDLVLAGDVIGVAHAIIAVIGHGQSHRRRRGLVQGELERGFQFARTALADTGLGGGPHDARLDPDRAFGQGDVAGHIAHLAIAVGGIGPQIGGGGRPVAQPGGEGCAQHRRAR